MVLRKDRAQSARPVSKRTPAGRVSIQYKARRPAPSRCRLCGAILGGMKPSRRACKSEKVPSRVFAGQLCGACVSDVVKAKARIRAKAAKAEDFAFAKREFIATV